jgi:hypothetical protein
MRGPTRARSALRRATVATLVTGSAVLSLLGGEARAAPVGPIFGPYIEGYAAYVGQTRCRPKPKPGVVAFQQMLQQAYPDSTWFNISRPCHVGGRSEHKEGRALDWARDATDPAQAATVADLFTWLLATDQHGNTHAHARRLGIMYIIWNRQMWSSWDQEWEIICVQRRKYCRDPDDRSIVNPHTDHVHFSFSRRGARMRTSYWHPELSTAAP